MKVFVDGEMSTNEDQRSHLEEKDEGGERLSPNGSRKVIVASPLSSFFPSLSLSSTSTSPSLSYFALRPFIVVFSFFCPLAFD